MIRLLEEERRVEEKAGGFAAEMRWLTVGNSLWGPRWSRLVAEVLVRPGSRSRSWMITEETKEENKVKVRRNWRRCRKYKFSREGHVTRLVEEIMWQRMETGTRPLTCRWLSQWTAGVWQVAIQGNHAKHLHKRLKTFAVWTIALLSHSKHKNSKTSAVLMIYFTIMFTYWEIVTILSHLVVVKKGRELAVHAG